MFFNSDFKQILLVQATRKVLKTEKVCPKLIQSCEYDTQEESILVDRIILGTNDPRIQDKLLNIQNLALDVAIGMCRNAEATKRHIENVRHKDETSIDAIKKNEYTPERRTVQTERTSRE
ncbi:hypothetical protein JTB14_022207 [Gonioctena quinquepunctata]|nr:hypothetical protein JTB14_022207 [Gonioctena quinquepunctata]